MRKLSEKISVIGADIMIMGTLSIISVNASMPNNWSLDSIKRQEKGSVSGLTIVNDNAIDFYCNYYKSKSGNTYAKCELTTVILSAQLMNKFIFVIPLHNLSISSYI